MTLEATSGDRTTVDRNQHLTFKANADVGRHGWLRLTPAYGVRLVRERIADLPAGAVVTDPFSGTGTTPLAAAEQGHRGQSVDVNPFLVWLGRAKTRHYRPEQCADAARLAGDVVDAALDVARSGDRLWQPPIFRIERWWSPGPLRGLSALRAALDAVDAEGAVRDLLEIALCRTLIDVSAAAFDHQSMSFKEPSAGGDGTGGDGTGPSDTVARFGDEARRLAGSAAHDLPGSATVVHGDSRQDLARLEPCDLLLTSPPYVNRMSYIRELRPYMYWLRYLSRSSDAGDLDWTAIGGTWGAATSRLTGWAGDVPTPVDDALAQVCGRIGADGGRNGPLLASYVRKYFQDMWLHFGAAAGHVRPGGTASYIIGNSTFYGHVVPAEHWYAAMLREVGFDRVTVTTIRKRNSNKALFEYEVSGRRG